MSIEHFHFPEASCRLVVRPVDVGRVDEGGDAVHLLAGRSGALAEGGRPRQLHHLGADVRFGGKGLRGDFLFRVHRLQFKPYVLSKLLNVGSLQGKLIGKQSLANTPERPLLVQQPLASLSGVRVMSWSRNWPNCICIRVACNFLWLGKVCRVCYPETST